MLMADDLIKALKEKFKNIHPLIFHRSLERAKTNGELFDILDTFHNEYPAVWSEDLKRWVITKDLFQAKNFSLKEGS